MVPVRVGASRAGSGTGHMLASLTVAGENVDHHRSIPLPTESKCCCLPECPANMNNVYFPAHVVVILRRIANVISGLSISNQYLLLKRARAEERDGVHLGPVPTAARFPTKAEWPEWMGRAEWDWLRFMTSGEPWLSLGDSVNVTVGNSILKCTSVCFWLSESYLI